MADRRTKPAKANAKRRKPARTKKRRASRPAAPSSPPNPPRYDPPTQPAWPTPLSTRPDDRLAQLDRLTRAESLYHDAAADGGINPLVFRRIVRWIRAGDLHELARRFFAKYRIPPAWPAAAPWQRYADLWSIAAARGLTRSVVTAWQAVEVDRETAALADGTNAGRSEA